VTQGARAAAAFAAGAVLMLALDETVARIVGLALMFAGIAMAAFAIATPEFIEADADRPDEPA
jgi:hypothetical protein